jgi:hypothetical protein
LKSFVGTHEKTSRVSEKDRLSAHHMAANLNSKSQHRKLNQRRNTVDTKTKLGLVLLAVVMPLSSAVHAATEHDALSSCMTALKANFEQSVGHGIDASLDENSGVSVGRIGRRTTFHLDAIDPVSGNIVVKADCIVNGDAKVVKLTTLPLDAKTAKSRSQLPTMF